MAYTNIKKSSDYFNTKIYTGNGSTQSITGVGFQPDWIFLKPRSQSGEHGLSVDSVGGNTKVVFPNLTNAEQTITNIVTAFGSDGFSLGDNAGANNNTSTYVAWNWKAGGTASSNTDGSITSNVSANTTSGFSIVSYTGTGSNATVGHGLSSAPKMIIIKDRTGTGYWMVYHVGIGSGANIVLNTTGGSSASSLWWQDTAPTSSVFSIGVNTNNNNNGSDYIAYCFAEKKGFSKFGSYTGNGNADGTFVYTGFKPAWVMVKTTGDNSWLIFDNKRSTFNLAQKYLYADASDAENDASTQGIDILSNGFKSRNSNTGTNQSGTTYIYMAFAEEPLVGDNPATAR